MDYWIFTVFIIFKYLVKILIKTKFSDESEDDDEFFDCAMDEQGNNSEFDEGKSRPKHSLWNRPVGRQCRYGNLRLIKTGEYLYIPITQVNSLP